jgi:hypothetical protein
LKVLLLIFCIILRQLGMIYSEVVLWRAIGGRGPEDVLRPSGGRETVPPKQHKVQ